MQESANFPEKINDNKSYNRITFEDVKKNPRINAYIQNANDLMSAIGYTEHGFRHATLTANIAHNILEHLDAEKREIELAAITGYLHDVGNAVCRHGHSQIGAMLAYDLLTEMSMDPAEIAVVISAIGNHEEYEHGEPVSNVSAAVILADKADVHRSRVQGPPRETDIHYRINFSAKHSFLRVNAQERSITLELSIETGIGSVMEYFEIFLDRMVICRKAAEFLGTHFQLEINGVKLLSGKNHNSHVEP